jgi:hypothetical protein
VNITRATFKLASRIIYLGNDKKFIMDQSFCSAKKLFCSVNFLPAKIFSGILEKENLSEQKKILAGKNSLRKKGYPIYIEVKIFLIFGWLHRSN